MGSAARAAGSPANAVPQYNALIKNDLMLINQFTFGFLPMSVMCLSTFQPHKSKRGKMDLPALPLNRDKLEGALRKAVKRRLLTNQDADLINGVKLYKLSLFSERSGFLLIAHHHVITRSATNMKAASFILIMIGAVISIAAMAGADGGLTQASGLVLTPYFAALALWGLSDRCHSRRAAQRAVVLTSALLAVATALVYLPLIIGHGGCMHGLLFLASFVYFLLGVPLVFGITYAILK